MIIQRLAALQLLWLYGLFCLLLRSPFENIESIQVLVLRLFDYLLLLLNQFGKLVFLLLVQCFVDIFGVVEHFVLYGVLLLFLLDFFFALARRFTILLFIVLFVGRLLLLLIFLVLLCLPRPLLFLSPQFLQLRLLFVLLSVDIEEIVLIRSLTTCFKSLFGKRHALLVIFVVDRLASLILCQYLGHKAAWELFRHVVGLVGAVRIDEYVLIEVLIVEVLKHHRASLESFLFLLLDLLSVLELRESLFVLLSFLHILLDFDALLQKDSGGNLRIREQFPEVFELRDALELTFHILLGVVGLHIRIAIAFFDRVPYLFAAEAPLLLQVLGGIVVLLVVIFVIDFVLHLVLLNFTSFLIFANLGAAPPVEGFWVVRAAVDVTTPVEV